MCKVFPSRTSHKPQCGSAALDGAAAGLWHRTAVRGTHGGRTGPRGGLQRSGELRLETTTRSDGGNPLACVADQDHRHRHFVYKEKKKQKCGPIYIPPIDSLIHLAIVEFSYRFAIFMKRKFPNKA